MSTKLEELGFKGSAAFTLNEEGSGAKYYRNSVYFPDSRAKPVTNSGVTIDPGIDLGSGDRKMIDEVMRFYYNSGFLSDIQYSLLKTAVSKKKERAAEWIENNERYFKNKFLIPDSLAEYVFANYSADDYWKFLTTNIPELLSMSFNHIKAAVHTSLLSLAYNYGMSRTANLAKARIQTGQYEELAHDIKSIKHNSKALRDRRQREGDLILDALKMKEKFAVVVDANINAMPMGVVPIDIQETMLTPPDSMRMV